MVYTMVGMLCVYEWKKRSKKGVLMSRNTACILIEFGEARSSHMTADLMFAARFMAVCPTLDVYKISEN